MRRRVGDGSLVVARGESIGDGVGQSGESQLMWDADVEMEILYSGEGLDERQRILLALMGGLMGLGGLVYLGTGIH